MSGVLFDFGTKYVKIWILNNETNLLTDFTMLKSVPSQLWMNKNGDYFIGEYDEKQTCGALYEGFNCSLEILYRLQSFPQEAKLHIKNITVGENTSLLCLSMLHSQYKQILKIFLVELMNHVFMNTNMDAVEKVSFLKPKLFYDEKIFSETLPVTFINKSEVVARIYGLEKFESDETFIIIDLGESNCDFIIARRTSEESIVEISTRHCKVGSHYIDILIYNFIVSEIKTEYSDGTSKIKTRNFGDIPKLEIGNSDDMPKVQMKDCELVKKKIKTGAVFVNYRYKSNENRLRFLLQTDIYESLSKPYVNKVISFVKKNVRDFDLDKTKNVFLIGGLSKVSKIESELKRIFGSRLNVDYRKY